MQQLLGAARSGDVVLQPALANFMEEVKHTYEIRLPGAVRPNQHIDRPEFQFLYRSDALEALDGDVIECVCRHGFSEPSNCTMIPSPLVSGRTRRAQGIRALAHRASDVTCPRALLVDPRFLEVAALDDGDGGRVHAALESSVHLLRCERGYGGLQFRIPVHRAVPPLPRHQKAGDGSLFGASQ